jgi:uncharacterized protein
MLNAKNISRKQIREWFINFTGDPNVQIGEGNFVDAYDEGGISMSLLTKQDHFEFRKKAFAEIYETPIDIDFGFPIVVNKINDFIRSVLGHKDARYVSQKCGMDKENIISVDLRGDVLTCQNVSSASVNSNGQPHLSGNITDFDNVKITSSTHWKERKECSNCPVLHICHGSCMYASGEYWQQSCANAYSNSVAFFALGFESITGYIPVHIIAKDLPLERQDIWGTVFEHVEEPIKNYSKGRKPFPIAVVTKI